MKIIKTHDRDFFYKYANYNTAINILGNLEVRWSSPLLFNDPFDTQVGIHLDFTSEEIGKMIFAEEEPSLANDNPYSSLIKQLRKERHKLNPAKFTSKVIPEIIEDRNSYKKLLHDENLAFIQEVKRMRVFCVSEIHDNLLMWAHYAGQHTGVVLKLKCIPELDTALCAAREVKYRPKIPVLATKEEYIKKYTGQIKDINHGDVFEKLAVTKSEHWIYEGEWRCITFRPINENLYDVYTLYPEEIDAIYLGCRMDKQNRDNILKLLTGKLKHVKISMASRSRTQFCLDFDDITKLKR